MRCHTPLLCALGVLCSAVHGWQQPSALPSNRSASEPPSATRALAAYDPSRALQFAYFAGAAYCDLDTVASWTCSKCVAADPSFTAKTFTNASTQMNAFVGFGSGEIVVSFRGTSNLENWIDNLQFSKRSVFPKCEGCEVHSGFFKTWLSMSSGVTSEVQRLHQLHPEASIYITGHSLGAAVAGVCALDLSTSSSSLAQSIAGVYTYGQPRLGNAAFAAFFEQRIRMSWRMTHWRDPVPHLPFESMGFLHSATEVFYNSDSSAYVVCDGSGEDPTCSNSLYFDYNIDDHLHYLDPPAGRISRC
ncbi:hypothetical protein AB1Y20_022654 [Prymnesium parvum]|uniref:Fungal lipase-type domain-containing protein n=1 Tax=Prymnesium parvum TaxID=97485 RepID=A0AB34JGG6_PRYPA